MKLVMMMGVQPSLIYNTQRLKRNVDLINLICNLY